MLNASTQGRLCPPCIVASNAGQTAGQGKGPWDSTGSAAPEVLVSENAGVTWSNKGSLKVDVPQPFTDALRPSVGHGVVIQDQMCNQDGATSMQCAKVGRMVVPLICTNSSSPAGGGDKGTCPSCTSCLVLSDDDGRTWKFGGVAQGGTREASIAQVPSHDTEARFYVNARNFGPRPGHRCTARNFPLPPPPTRSHLHQT